MYRQHDQQLFAPKDRGAEMGTGGQGHRVQVHRPPSPDLTSREG